MAVCSACCGRGAHQNQSVFRAWRKQLASSGRVRDSYSSMSISCVHRARGRVSRRVRVSKHAKGAASNANMRGLRCRRCWSPTRPSLSSFVSPPVTHGAPVHGGADHREADTRVLIAVQSRRIAARRIQQQRVVGRRVSRASSYRRGARYGRFRENSDCHRARF